MPAKKRVNATSIVNLAATLTEMRHRSRRTQAEVAAEMGTTQTAIARLESGRLSPNVQTLQNYARANGFCLEIGFVAGPDINPPRTGCIMIVEGDPQKMVPAETV